MMMMMPREKNQEEEGREGSNSARTSVLVIANAEGAVTPHRHGRKFVKIWTIYPLLWCTQSLKVKTTEVFRVM